MSEATPKARYWIGTAPDQCDICKRPINGRKFVDGATRFGQWAIMDLGCHRTDGAGVGTGRGQVYEKQTDGRYLKVEG